MLVTSRARIVDPQTSHREDKLAKEGVWAQEDAQCYSLLDGMGPGVVLAAGRRRKVLRRCSGPERGGQMLRQHDKDSTLSSEAL